MKMMLAENIRSFRKERSLTQEQLAEALGVTAGAVYKWEAKLSIPELELIIQMADFFDISVDVLLGYEVKDNRLEATVKRLREYRRSKDWDGLAEAEKALKKYPHSFQIVSASAALYRAFGFDSGDKALFRRALELLEQSRLLLSQNDDPQVSGSRKRIWGWAKRTGPSSFGKPITPAGCTAPRSVIRWPKMIMLRRRYRFCRRPLRSSSPI